MNIFLCKKCDKLNEEKALNMICNTEPNKYNDIIYYKNTLYNSYYSSQKYLNKLNSTKLPSQEDELQIIDYPYEQKNESKNNFSKSTLKIYNFEEDNLNINELNKPVKNYLIKNIFTNIKQKKKNIMLNRNNFKYYFLKNPKCPVHINNTYNSSKSNDTGIKNKNKINTRNNKKKIDVNYNKNNLNKIADVNSFHKVNTNINNKFKDKKTFCSVKNVKEEKNNVSNRNINNYKNKCLSINNMKKNDNLILIKQAIRRKLKTMNCSLNKKTNLNRYTVFCSSLKNSTSQIVSSKSKNIKKNKTKKSY